MKDKVALVTGASRGIGAATARMLARHGAAVAVNYFRSANAARKVVSEIVDEGGNAIAVRADVRNMNQVEAMSRKVAETLGPIDTLVLNASISFPVLPFLKIPWKDFQAKLVGELQAAFFCCKAVVPAMVMRKKGCIIGISSGLSRVVGEGFCAHSTAKSGLDAFMKSLALELGPKGIRVNVVAPGLTETDATAFLSKKEKDAAALITPLKRIGLPDDVAGAVVLLASEEARFVSGAYLPVSGGIHMT
ncbi:MAG: short-chain dehydrogenase [Deltaproteobacteria bacterium GWC2_65_14]|nr:MAG: short-chain dehydrogenase [Deltaproteobacteria bacterium GWC2_65_14]